jgi:hypothetical protein
MDLEETVCTVFTHGSGQGPVEGSCENGKEHFGTQKGTGNLTSLAIISFSRTIQLHGVSQFESQARNAILCKETIITPTTTYRHELLVLPIQFTQHG